MLLNRWTFFFKKICLDGVGKITKGNRSQHYQAMTYDNRKKIEVGTRYLSSRAKDENIDSKLNYLYQDNSSPNKSSN